MKMQRHILALASAWLIATSTAHGATSIVINGGFETGSFSPDWSLSDVDLFATGVVHSDGFYHSGYWGAALGQADHLGQLSQTLTTTLGQTYDLSFWMKTLVGVGNEFKVEWNGIGTQELMHEKLIPVSTDFELHTFLITADAASTTVTFSFRHDPGYFALDDISVTPVPEPSTYLAGISALSMVWLTAWRNRKQTMTTKEAVPNHAE